MDIFLPPWTFFSGSSLFIYMIYSQNAIRKKESVTIQELVDGDDDDFDDDDDDDDGDDEGDDDDNITCQQHQGQI